MMAAGENDRIFRFRKTTLLDRAIDRLRFTHCYRNNRLNLAPSAEQQELIGQLRRDGYVMLKGHIPLALMSQMQQKLCGMMQELCFETPCLAQSKIDPIRDIDLIQNHLYATPRQFRARGLAFEKQDCHNYEQVVSEFNPSTLTLYPLTRSKEFRAAWLDPFILGIVSGYLGMVPKLAEAYVRRNFPSPYRTMNHYWHRDLNHKHFMVKVFYFFSDCTLDNGPHEFIRGSQCRFDRFNGKRYYSDEEVGAVCPRGAPDRVISEVPAGTVIIEDTRGLHRADMPKTGYRDLGYATFIPMRANAGFKYYDFPKDDSYALSDFQRAFLPAINLV